MRLIKNVFNLLLKLIFICCVESIFIFCIQSIWNYLLPLFWSNAPIVTFLETLKFVIIIQVTYFCIKKNNRDY